MKGVEKVLVIQGFWSGRRDSNSPHCRLFAFKSMSYVCSKWTVSGRWAIPQLFRKRGPKGAKIVVEAAGIEPDADRAESPKSKSTR